MSLATLSKKEADELRVYARRKQTALTLRQLFDFGYALDDKTLLTAAQFLHHELPKRLAGMALDLDRLPCGLSDMPSIRQTQELYFRSFRDMREFPLPQNRGDEEEFTRLLDRIKDRHRHVVESMARGLMELRRKQGGGDIACDVHPALDRFYLTRIGIRVLIGQHIALHEQRDNCVGIVCSDCSPALVAREAANHAMELCRMHYGEAPEVKIVGRTGLTFTYIPTHLHHMFFELLKNSARAVVERHQGKTPLPPIQIVIARGREDVAIRISDEGGGIPRSGTERIWTYLYTTAELPEEHTRAEIDPMAGYGFGLPITRLYARYFGGDLQVISLEGYGTDAFLHLNRLGTAQEVLPGSDTMPLALKREDHGGDEDELGCDACEEAERERQAKRAGQEATAN